MAKGVEDYYLGQGEAPGAWLGKGAAALGLEGQVEPEALVAVLSGRDPATGEWLVSGKAAAKGRVPGFDLTLSAPKSVSLLFALGDEAVSGLTRGAHDRAVAPRWGSWRRRRRGCGGAMTASG